LSEPSLRTSFLFAGFSIGGATNVPISKFSLVVRAISHIEAEEARTKR
jgi:hypothetical protein